LLIFPLLHPSRRRKIITKRISTSFRLPGRL
jgi:hypothetical protein